MPSKKRYTPPKQSGWGQAIDCIFILVLVYVCLLLPLFIGGGPNTYTVHPKKTHETWQALHQNSTMQKQWEQLGIKPNKAATMINTRFNYSINPIMLAITAAVITGYFLILLMMSKREYKEVIKEAFDKEYSSR